MSHAAYHIMSYHIDAVAVSASRKAGTFQVPTPPFKAELIPHTSEALLFPYMRDDGLIHSSPLSKKFTIFFCWESLARHQSSCILDIIGWATARDQMTSIANRKRKISAH